MEYLSPGFVLSVGFAIFVIITVAKTARIVPNKSAVVIERLGRYRTTLRSGFHILIPFLDKVAYEHTLKEEVIDVPQQMCITKDNIEVGVDGVIYLQVIDAEKASYGIDDYRNAAAQLAQTTMRSVIGKMELDTTFEERAKINSAVMEALDEAASPWGVKLLRYEVSDIQLPASIKDALEQQMKAERERRATIARSEGEKQEKINISEGEKQAVINASLAEKEKQINEAQGRAEEITLLAEATGGGIERIATSINKEGGTSAVNLRIAEQYVEQFGHLAKETTSMIVPANLSDVSGMVAGLSTILDQVKPK
jgi:regulator of protease activity HflC (stomatin/prohibitin superfamily)